MLIDLIFIVYISIILFNEQLIALFKMNLQE